VATSPLKRNGGGVYLMLGTTFITRALYFAKNGAAIREDLQCSWSSEGNFGKNASARGSWSAGTRKSGKVVKDPVQTA